MIQYTLPDGTKLVGGPFAIGVESEAIRFPANWLDLATDEDLAIHGITKVVVSDPQPPIVTRVAWTTFVGRFTDVEWAGVQKTINAQVAAGNGGLARWITLASMNGVDVSQPQTLTYKGQLVTAGILMQGRADAIFVAP